MVETQTAMQAVVVVVLVEQDNGIAQVYMLTLHILLQLALAALAMEQVEPPVLLGVR